MSNFHIIFVNEILTLLSIFYAIVPSSDIQIVSFCIEGAYETSSEGVISLKQSDTEICKRQTKESLCLYFKNKSTSLSKLVAFNKNVPLIKEDVIPDSSHEYIENWLTRKITMKNKTTHNGSLIFVSENLAKSKSMPILKSEISSTISTNFKAMDALISESSFAREKKMSMIVKKMAPLISSMALTRSSDMTTNFHDQKDQAQKVESRTMPILCVRLWIFTINESSNLIFTNNKKTNSSIKIYSVVFAKILVFLLFENILKFAYIVNLT